MKNTHPKIVTLLATSIILSSGCIPPLDEEHPTSPANVSGTVTGLNGGSIELVIRNSENQETETQTINSNGSFEFELPFQGYYIYGHGGLPVYFYPKYEVRLISQTDESQFCNIGNRAGEVTTAGVSDVHVECGEPVIANLESLVPDRGLAECINTTAWELGYTSLEELTELICSMGGSPRYVWIGNTGTEPGDKFVGSSRKPILDTTGIDQLTGLTLLDLYKNPFTTIDVSNNLNLRYLRLSESLLETLDISSNTQLQALMMIQGVLTELTLPASGALEEIQLEDNQLSELNIGAYANLRYLNAGHNMVSDIDLTLSPSIVYVTLNDNQIETIDISTNTEIIDLKLDNNLLTTINLDSITTSDVRGTPGYGGRIYLRGNPLDAATEAYLDEFAADHRSWGVFYDDNF